ncbi:MAG: hypothetical protein JW927_00240 [Deltaproteobacteria bacterium]|nr:hypothetical protein [Deltaproteobacteria bacterium]
MDLVRKLSSVGKQAFVENYEIFQRYASSRITREDAIDQLVKIGVSNEAGAAIRVGNAKLIFDDGKQKEALNLVLKSKRIPPSITNEARRIIGENS